MASACEGAHDRWAPWIDPLLLEWLLDGGGTDPAEQWINGALTLIDISGFTALTERMMRSGPAGVEHVKEILDGTFGTLTSLVTAFGGKVLKFPGDAVLTIWPGSMDDERERVQRAAVYALHAIPALAARQLPHDDTRLTGRAAIVSGPVRLLFVGGLDGQWHSLVDGEPLRHLAAAMAGARPGEVVLSEQARGALADSSDFQLTRTHSSLYVLRPWTRAALDMSRTRYQASVPELLRPLPASAVAAVPKAAFEHVRPEGFDALAQFRLVTAMFVRFGDPEAPARALEHVHRDVYRLHEEAVRYGGVVTQTVVDDKGTVAVVGWGLSGSAHEDNAARAVLAALAVIGSERPDSRLSVGIATGRVFTGARGASERLEYAMIGHSVNLAARLMQQAGDGILCDDATRAAARTRVVFEPVTLPPAVGLQMANSAFRPLRTKDRIRPGLDGLVGRRAELSVLMDAFHRLEAGRAGGTVVVEGEPGIGKSRLVAALVAHTQTSHVRSLIARGDPVERSPYHAWRVALERLLALNGLDIDDQRSRLLYLLGESRVSRAPLLGEVWGIPFAETETTRPMTPQGRADETRELLFHLVSNAVRNTPTLLVLEDAHWFDTGSWALADALVTHIKPLLCIVATRPMLPDATGRTDAPFIVAPGVVRLPLDSLDRQDALALACQCLDADRIPWELNALVWDKARGHPFYIEQLVLALRDSGLVHVDRGDCQLRGDAAAALSRAMPETVQGIVTSRVDRLTPGQQTTLKVASVIGIDIGLTLIHAVSPDRISTEALRRDLDVMVALGLLSRTIIDGPQAYSFKHAITRQVTYELLPFAQRRALHAAVARQLEADGSATHARLAHHWIQAAVPHKAFHHLVAAGEASARGDANREAADFFRQALALDLSAGDAPADLIAFQRARCHRLLAESLWVIGMFGEVPGEIAASFRLLGGREPWVRSRYRLLATQLAVQAWHLVAGTARVHAHPEQRERRLELSRAASLLATLRASPRDTVALLADSLLTLNLAEQAGSTNVLALGLLGYTADAVGLRHLSNTYFERARVRARELDELNSYALVLLFECMVRFGAGDHVRAAALLHEGLHVARQLNDRRALARAADLLSVAHSFTFAESAVEAMRHVTAAIDSIRDRPVADRTYFLMTLRALSAMLLRPQDARTLFAPLEDMVVPSLAHCTADAAALMHAANALFHARQGDIGAAVAAADQAVAWGRGRLRELPPSGWVFFEGPIEAYLAAAARGTAAASALQQAREAVSTLARYARRCPIYGPRARHFEARLALLEGRPAGARDKWEMARVGASRLGLVLDEARAQVHLAALAADDDARRRHLARARALLEPVGSDFFLDWLKQEEARGSGKDRR